jgi:hypothetical protein
MPVEYFFVWFEKLGGELVSFEDLAWVGLDQVEMD